MSVLPFSYQDCIEASERVRWSMDEVLRESQRLDFTLPFLARGLSPVQDLAFLGDDERRTLNHVRANSYLWLLAFVEEYIISQMSLHAEAERFQDRDVFRALLRFTEEEVKHQQMFQRFGAAFARDFPTTCELLGDQKRVATSILSKGPVAVVLLTLHLELITQVHYLEAAREAKASALEPLFVSLLKHHWLEEAQHARLDLLELYRLVEGARPEDLRASFDDYLELVRVLGGLLDKQAELDVESAGRALNRPLRDHERTGLLASQRRAYDRSFLLAGLRHPTQVSALAHAFGDDSGRVAALADDIEARGEHG